MKLRISMFFLLITMLSQAHATIIIWQAGGGGDESIVTDPSPALSSQDEANDARSSEASSFHQTLAEAFDALRNALLGE